MPKSAISTPNQTVNPEVLDLFAEEDRETIGELMLMVQSSTYPFAYKIVERTIRLAPECDRQRIVGFAIMSVVGQADEATQVRKALEIQESERHSNLSELVPSLNPEDRQPTTMPPDPITLLGQEGLYALNGLTRFVLLHAYKCAPEEQKVLVLTRIYNLLDTNGEFRKLIDALRILFEAYRANRSSKDD